MTKIKYFKHSYKHAQLWKFKDHSVVFLLLKINMTCKIFPMKKDRWLFWVETCPSWSGLWHTYPMATRRRKWNEMRWCGWCASPSTIWLNLLFWVWGMRRKKNVSPGLWIIAWLVRQCRWGTTIIQQVISQDHVMNLTILDRKSKVHGWEENSQLVRGRFQSSSGYKSNEIVKEIKGPHMSFGNKSINML